MRGKKAKKLRKTAVLETVGEPEVVYDIHGTHRKDETGGVVLQYGTTKDYYRWLKKKERR